MSDSMKRRDFLKLMGGTSAALATGGFAPKMQNNPLIKGMDPILREKAVTQWPSYIKEVDEPTYKKDIVGEIGKFDARMRGFAMAGYFPGDGYYEKIYELYKSREGVEKHFETFKSELGADKLYLRDADSVFGHFFVAFLSLYLYCRLIQRLKKAELNRKYSPKDVLLKLSKVSMINYETRSVMTEVPKQVRNLAEKLELEIIPK